MVCRVQMHFVFSLVAVLCFGLLSCVLLRCCSVLLCCILLCGICLCCVVNRPRNCVLLCCADHRLTLYVNYSNNCEVGTKLKCAQARKSCIFKLKHKPDTSSKVHPSSPSIYILQLFTFASSSCRLCWKASLVELTRKQLRYLTLDL